MTDTPEEEKITRDFEARRLREMADSQRDLRASLEQITQCVQHNEQLFSRIFALETQLLRATDPEDVCLALLRGLRADFALDMVRLWFDRSSFIGQCPLHRLSESDLVWVEEGEIESLGLTRQPVWLVRLERNERFVWLGKADAQLMSMALVVLGPESRPFGVLGLGSLDAERFSPEQGGEFLHHLGQVLSLMLEHTLSRERLARMMVRDHLSGAHNRRFFQPYSHQPLSQWFGRDMPVLCMALQLPEEASGEEKLLQRLVDELRLLLRHQDILLRQQDAYFVMFLPGVRPMQDVDLAEAVMDTCMGLPWPVERDATSLGVALSRHDEDPAIAELLERAENARRRAAEQGGLRIEYDDAGGGANAS